MAAADHLTPFRKGDSRASEAGRKGAAVREARRAIARGEASDIAAHLRTLIATHNRAAMGEAMAVVAIDIAGRLARGEIPLRHGGDAAEVLRVLVDIARLEAGLSTSNAAVVHVSAEQARAHIEVLRKQAREVLSSAASTADDAGTGDEAG